MKRCGLRLAIESKLMPQLEEVLSFVPSRRQISAIVVLLPEIVTLLITASPLPQDRQQEFMLRLEAVFSFLMLPPCLDSLSDNKILTNGPPAQGPKTGGLQIYLWICGFSTRL